jgi:hypothetical protein
MRYAVIESPGRGGFYCGFDDREAGFIPTWRWSVPASHDDVRKFFSLPKLNAELEKVRKFVPDARARFLEGRHDR